MKQILQNLKTGELILEDVPATGIRAGEILIQTRRSLISAGTERMLLEFGRASYLGKARQQPDKVAQIIQKVRTDGLAATLEAVQTKLDQPIPLGYSNVGKVIGVGSGVTGLSVGDRVVSNGRHAEIVSVPANLCAPIPPGVSDEEAAFAVVASIGLHGIRLVAPTLGESVCVFGLGLIGLLTVQMLRAHGARVIGFDFDERRIGLARTFGAEAYDLTSEVDPVRTAVNFSGTGGIDAVLITASTKSNDVMHQAAQMSRKRGRIVLTGVVGLDLDRADFYEKEISFQVSCSYGPGRYDPTYEEKGHDYPIGYVRWTEQRNFSAVLGLMAEGRLKVEPMISKRVPFVAATDAYAALRQRDVTAVILTYDQPDSPGAALTAVPVARSHKVGALGVLGVIGAGNFAQMRALPALASSGARLKWIASSRGTSSAHAAKRFGFEWNTTEYRRILDDPEVDAVVIATRHGSHAKLVTESLEAGKSVFVEKPLCVSRQELVKVRLAWEAASRDDGRGPILMVGFNRRFAPLTERLKGFLAGRSQPLAMTFLCNAGAIPPTHWTQDQGEGGRIIGEAIHFMDYLHFLAGSDIARVSAVRLDEESTDPRESDTVAISCSFADGSVGQISYFATGPKSFPKERLDVLFDGKAFTIDNFRSLRAFGVRAFSRKSTFRQDKGHEAGFHRFVEAVVKGEESPIPFASILNVQNATFSVIDSLASGTQELVS